MDLHYRKETMDLEIWQSVVDKNEYHLPDQFTATDTVVDIGAHIGAFTWAVMTRGAGRCYAFEPDPDNCRLLRVNTAQWQTVTVIRKAVWWEKRHIPYSGYARGKTNTGGGNIIMGKGQPVETVVFDSMLHKVGHVRLLKVDCEGAEWAILMSSRMLKNVQEICGELHYWDVFPRLARLPKVFHYKFGDLLKKLKRAGFRPKIEIARKKRQPILAKLYAPR